MERERRFTGNGRQRIAALDLAGFAAAVLHRAGVASVNARLARAEDLFRQLKSLPPAAGHAEILYPGELEVRSEERACLEGIAPPTETQANLGQIACASGLAPPIMRTHG